jgi:hypothetical protein
MSEATEFTIGSEVVCSDGACGELTRVVINPIARAVTHLVVKSASRQGKSRLVPLSLVESAGHEIRLSCSKAEFEALEELQEVHFLTDPPNQPGYPPSAVLAMPFYPPALMWLRSGLGTISYLRHVGGVDIGVRLIGRHADSMTEDLLPQGEVEVRRGERVYATDGPIGHIHGFAIDPTDHHVTHVLLDEGHMWGKKQVAIPASAVRDVSDGVALTLTKREVGDLPPVELGE